MGKPFHESIVDTISHCDLHERNILAISIKNTFIPKNHDAIIAAWQKRMKALGSVDCGVVESILKQKKKAEEKTAEKEFPGSFISLEEFKNLKRDSKITDRHGIDWVVEFADCGTPGQYLIHLFYCSLNNERHHMFHDGKYLRFLSEQKVCGDFV